jgi:hypothetical protein
MESQDMREHQESLRGQTVFAPNGDEVGEVDAVLYDKASGKPEWLAVQMGRLGLKTRLAPFHGAERRSQGVFVSHSRSQIEAAPEFGGEEISQETERRLASHYQLQYSERRSSSGLAERRKPKRAAQTGRRAQRTSGRRTTKQQSRTSRRSPRSKGPTREELYEEAKQLDIEGRSRMNKAQLARVVGRRRGQSSRTRGGKANPVEVQKFLEGVGYPTRKRSLVNEAKKQGARKEVHSTLERLPDREFDSPAAVSEAIGRLRR